MIKPNRYELELMTGEKLNSLKEIRDAAQKYLDMGVSVVTVSLGSEGALITDGDETLYAPKLALDVKSTVGAGDAMVGGTHLRIHRRQRAGGRVPNGRCLRLRALRHRKLSRDRQNRIQTPARSGQNRARLEGRKTASERGGFCPKNERRNSPAHLK